MKHKEKEHLRQDPLMHFMEKFIALFRKHKKEIFMAGAALGVVLLAVFGIIFVNELSAGRENRLFSQAMQIKNDQTLTGAEKIERLLKLKTRRGISSAARLYAAALYFEYGEYQNAQKQLDLFDESRVRLLNEQKQLLQAQILNAMGKGSEAVSVLNLLLADANTEIGKDFILLELAKIQLRNNQAADAQKSLQRIISEFPMSAVSGEAQSLLSSLSEENSQPS